MGSLERLLLTGVQYMNGAHQQGAAQAAANEQTSTYPKLKAALNLGSKLSLKQAKRLEKVFKTLDMQPSQRPDAGMQGIIEANNTLIAEAFAPAERDLINISMTQTAAHFYIAKYGTLRTYALKSGNKRAARLLQRTLREMGALDKKYTTLAYEVMAQKKVAGKKKSSGGVLTTALTLGSFAAVAQILLNKPERSSVEPVSIQ